MAGPRRRPSVFETETTSLNGHTANTQTRPRGRVGMPVWWKRLEERWSLRVPMCLHLPWSCLSCCWLTDVVCSFQARISRVQLDLLQGESDNHIFLHSQQFDMDFVKWVCTNVRFCYLALSASNSAVHYSSVDEGCCRFTLPLFFFFFLSCLLLSGKPASRLSHQPHRHRTGYWVPHGRGLSV